MNLICWFKGLSAASSPRTLTTGLGKITKKKSQRKGTWWDFSKRNLTFSDMPDFSAVSCQSSHYTMLTCPRNFAGEIRSGILQTCTSIEQVTVLSRKTIFKIIFLLHVQWNANTTPSADNKLTEFSLSFFLPLMWHFPLPWNCRPWQSEWLFEKLLTPKV